MQAVKRRITYRLYPTPAQELRLEEALRLHCELYNAALQERRDAYRRCQKSISFYEQDRQLTQIRKDRPEMVRFGRKAFVGTLRRVKRAFDAFFRRARAGQAPGYPRFKSHLRFSGWDYPAAGDGWHLHPGRDGRHGKLKLMGIGVLRLRGRGRQPGRARTCTISKKGKKWYTSIAVECEPKRERGQEAIGFDWGVASFLTLHTGEKVAPPEFAHQAEAKVAKLRREVARKRLGSRRRRAAVQLLASECRKVAERRKNFLHQVSTKLVGRAGLLCTEKLAIKNLTRSARGTRVVPGKNVRQKAGLNRKILDGAPAAFLQLLRYKAEEAGTKLWEVNTRKVKPSQTCPGCGEGRKKKLSERVHRCSRCGLIMPRDQAAALVCLQTVLEVGWSRDTEGHRPCVEGRISAPVKRETASKQLSLFGGR